MLAVQVIDKSGPGKIHEVILVTLRSRHGAVKYVILVTIYYIYRTSMLSFEGCLQEPKPILKYALVECLNEWINEEWENLELYYMKNNAAENNY